MGGFGENVFEAIYQPHELRILFMFVARKAEKLILRINRRSRAIKIFALKFLDPAPFLDFRTQVSLVRSMGPSLSKYIQDLVQT